MVFKYKPDLFSCGAGAGACAFNDDTDNFPEFTKEQWIAIMQSPDVPKKEVKDHEI